MLIFVCGTFPLTHEPRLAPRDTNFEGSYDVHQPDRADEDL